MSPRHGPAPNDLVLAFSAEDILGNPDPVDRAIMRWQIAVLLGPFYELDPDEDEPDDGVIGRASASVLSLENADHARIGVAEALDAVSAELEHLSTVYDAEIGTWSEDLELATFGGAALLVETMELKPGFRGLGLGPAVLAGIVERLGSGCAFAALEPSPFGELLDGKSYDEATRALERLWQAVGFEPYRDGVWVVDLGTEAFWSCRDEIFRDRHRTR